MISASISDPQEYETIITAVEMLTHEKNQPYTEYVLDLSSNQTAFRVKLADMLHNLTSSPSDRQKQKYGSALHALIEKHGSLPGISSSHQAALVKATRDNQQNENFLRTFVREALKEAGTPGHSWKEGNASSLMLDKEGIEKSDRDNLERYLKALGLLK